MGLEYARRIVSAGKSRHFGAMASMSLSKNVHKKIYINWIVCNRINILLDSEWYEEKYKVFQLLYILLEKRFLDLLDFTIIINVFFLTKIKKILTFCPFYEQKSTSNNRSSCLLKILCLAKIVIVLVKFISVIRCLNKI